MGGIGQKHYPAQLLLPPGGRPVQSLHFRIVQNFTDGIVITGIPSDIDRQYHFGVFIDRSFYLVRIDSKIIFYVYHNHLCPHIHGTQSRGTVCVSGDNHFITGTYSQPTQHQHRPGGPRIYTQNSFTSCELTDFIFQSPCFGACRQPARMSQGIMHFCYYLIIDDR